MNAGPPPEAGTIAAGGTAGPAPTEPVAGTAGSPEVAPAVVTAPPVVEEPEAPSTTPQKAQPPRSKPRPTAEFIKVKNPLQIVQRDGRYGVAAGKRSGLTAGMELKVVGAAGSNGLRKVLGRATVLELLPKKALLKLDDTAGNAKGDRFVAMPTDAPDEAAEAEAEAEAPPAPPVPAPEAPVRRLSVGVRQTGLLGINEIDRTFIVYNAENKVLSNCKATIHRRGQYVFAHLRTRENKVKQGQFKPNAQAPVVQEGKMLIECDEGRVEAEIQS